METAEFVHTLPTGEKLVLRLCRNAKADKGTAQLYCTRDGRFFSVTRRSVHEVKYNFPPSRRTPGRHCYNGKRGSTYPCMCHFGSKNCHILVYEAWVDERHLGMQIDHINGDIMNWSADNLQEVTPSENIRRSRYLRVIRACGFDPRIFSKKDFMYWFSMPFEEFKTFFNHYKND